MIDTPFQIPDGRTIPGTTGAEPALLANRYRVVRQLGQGGMGSVWLAEDTQRKGKQVAIKMLPSILVKNKKAVRQLREEAEHWEKLSHPNIATLRMYEENAGNPFLVVDFIDGETLEDYLAEKGKLSEEDTIKLLSPIAQVLDYAHEQGVIHRDVKPANIMVRKDGKPFVLDFGIARELHETMTRVTGALSSGTLMYMSPEQLHGAEPDPKQDVYAFAAMAYECLTGAPPFSRGQIEYQIEHDQPKPLLQPISIAPFVMAGLSKSADDRPPSCCSIVGLASASLPTPPAPHPSSKKLLIFLGGIVLLGLAGTFAFIVSHGNDTSADNQTASVQPQSEISHQPIVKPPIVETQVVEKVITPPPKTEIVERTVVVTQIVAKTEIPIEASDLQSVDENEDEENESEDENADDDVEEVAQDKQVAVVRSSAIGKQILQEWLYGNIQNVRQLLLQCSQNTLNSDPDILFVSGQMHDFGIGTQINKTEALKRYDAAMKSGSTLGKIAYFITRDELKFSAAAGCVVYDQAMLVRAENILRPLAQKNDLAAMFWLGYVMSLKNDNEAGFWLKRAHEKGSYQATVALASEDNFSFHDRTIMQKLENYALQGIWDADCVLVIRYMSQNDIQSIQRCYLRSCSKIDEAVAAGDPLAMMVANAMMQFNASQQQIQQDQFWSDLRQKTIKMRQDARQRMNQWKNQQQQNLWPVNQQNWTW